MKQKQNYNSKGFTIIELLVVISIMGIMGTLLVVNFNSTRNRRNLVLSSNELVTNIRKTQSYALSARNVGPNLPAKYYVVQFDFINNPGQYQILAVDSNYDPTPTLIETIQLPDGVLLDAEKSFLTQPVTDGVTTTSSCLQILFGLPFGKIYMIGSTTKSGCNSSYVDTLKDPSALAELANSEVNIQLRSTTLKPDVKNEYFVKSIGINGLSGTVTVSDEAPQKEITPTKNEKGE